MAKLRAQKGHLVVLNDLDELNVLN
jgi:hypothetical protein